MTWFLFHLFFLHGYEHVNILGFDYEYPCRTFAVIVERDIETNSPLRIQGVYCSENHSSLSPFDWNY